MRYLCLDYSRIQVIRFFAVFVNRNDDILNSIYTFCRSAPAGLGIFRSSGAGGGFRTERSRGPAVKQERKLFISPKGIVS